MTPEQFEQHRERLQVAPHGVWSTNPRQPEDQILSIHEDSLGICRIADPRGGQTIHFTWSAHEDCCLLVRRIDERTGESDPEDEWLYLRYVFEEAGPSRVVMRLIEFGNLQSFAKPLYYHGPATPEIVQALKKPPPASAPPPIDDWVHGRIIPALFWSGLLAGGGFAFCKIFEIEAEPLPFLIAAGVLFVFLAFIFFRPKTPAPDHEAPPVEEEYTAQKFVPGRDRERFD